MVRSDMSCTCIWRASGRASGAGDVPGATPGGAGGAGWAATATDAMANAGIAPPIKYPLITACLLLMIDPELNHRSLLAIERRRNEPPHGSIMNSASCGSSAHGQS